MNESQHSGSLPSMELVFTAATHWVFIKLPTIPSSLLIHHRQLRISQISKIIILAPMQITLFTYNEAHVPLCCPLPQFRDIFLKLFTINARLYHPEKYILSLPNLAISLLMSNKHPSHEVNNTFTS